MIKETGEVNSVVRQIGLLVDDDNIIFSPFSIQSQKLLADAVRLVHKGTAGIHTNAIPTIPNPTTTTLFLLLDPFLDFADAPLIVMIYLVPGYVYQEMEEVVSSPVARI
jgi:hypothetical protein